MITGCISFFFPSIHACRACAYSVRGCPRACACPTPARSIYLAAPAGSGWSKSCCNPSPPIKFIYYVMLTRAILYSISLVLCVAALRIIPAEQLCSKRNALVTLVLHQHSSARGLLALVRLWALSWTGSLSSDQLWAESPDIVGEMMDRRELRPRPTN